MQSCRLILRSRALTYADPLVPVATLAPKIQDAEADWARFSLAQRIAGDVSRKSRFFNKIKQCRRVATRYDKLAANYPAFIKLASIRIWLRANESAP